MNKEKRKVPKLRFPDCNRLWEEYRLADLLVERSVLCTQSEKYPLVSFTVESGVTPKTERYDREALVVGHKASKKYKMTLVDDIVYNPANLKFGAIARNKYGNAVFSPIYVTLEVQTNRVFPKFIEYILTSKCFINRALRYQQGTVYERQSVNVESLLLQTVNIPAKDEQIKISDLLYKFDQLLGLYQHKLKMLLLKKKALLQKLFPKDGERYPELRFPGFTDAWEQRKLGEIFEYLQNNTLSRDSLNYKNPNIKNIHYGDILVKFDEILDGSNKDIPYINSELDLSKFSKSLLRDGDIVFSDTAEDDAVGKAIELQNVSVPFILSGLHTIPCRPLIPFGKGYLGNFLNSDSYRMQLRPLVQGIKVSSISKSALKDTMIVYPKKLDEQEKIGGLFYHISKMITLHQRKLDHLQLQKKALLQQMFV